MTNMPDILELLPALIIPLLLLALLIVGVVRSGGVPRVLLAVVAVVSAINVFRIPLTPYLLESMGMVAFGYLSTALGVISGVSLALALIIGRPGVRPGPRQGYGPGSAYTPPPQHPGAPYQR